MVGSLRDPRVGQEEALEAALGLGSISHAHGHGAPGKTIRPGGMPLANDWAWAWRALEWMAPASMSLMSGTPPW